MSTHSILFVFLLLRLCLHSRAWVSPLAGRQLPHGKTVATRSESIYRTPMSLAAASKDSSVDMDFIKSELLSYLKKREELGADEIAKSEVGKVIGGTKGNPILEFVSGSPNKARVVDKPPNALDYDQLTKYGYGHLVTPIMNAGGRFEMYRMLELEAPTTATALKKLSSPKLVIDRTGESDPKRYTGLKLRQIFDDSVQEQALIDALAKKAGGQTPSNEDDEYVIPFSDKRNISPKQTPDWTAERLDDWGKSQGRVEAWARRAKAGEFVSDPEEAFELTLQQQVYSVVMTLLVVTAFGKSTDSFLVDLTHLVPNQEAATLLKEILQPPAIGLVLASLGSFAFAYVQSKEKNRNPLLWSIKGILGGPFTVSTLRNLDSLITREQQDNNQRALAKK